MKKGTDTKYKLCKKSYINYLTFYECIKILSAGNILNSGQRNIKECFEAAKKIDKLLRWKNVSG